MTDLVYDYITMGVDMMISAAILTSMVLLLRSSSILSSYSAQQQATADRINYYREFAMYDNTTGLLSPDVLSAIVYYKYDLDIVIELGGNIIISNDKKTGTYKLNNNGTITTISYDSLVNYIGTDRRYKAFLVEDYSHTRDTDGYKGGIISGLIFTKTS